MSHLNFGVPAATRTSSLRQSFLYFALVCRQDDPASAFLANHPAGLPCKRRSQEVTGIRQAAPLHLVPQFLILSGISISMYSGPTSTDNVTVSRWLRPWCHGTLEHISRWSILFQPHSSQPRTWTLAPPPLVLLSSGQLIRGTMICCLVALLMSSQ